MKVESNIFGSPPNTGPGNFGRRLGAALSSLGVELVPPMLGQDAKVFLGNAFLDGSREYQFKVLRVDGPGAGQDIPRVKQSHIYCDYCIYQSYYSRKVLQERHNHKPARSIVIRNGIELPSYTRATKFNYRFLSVCNTWNLTRYDNALRAVYNNLEEIVKVFPDFEWTIIGKYGDFLNAMITSQAVRKSTFDKHIRFVDFTTNVDFYRQYADACIHLVDGDSCPNSVIESMAHGLPCIVWHNSAGPELIWGVAGATLSDHTPERIIEAIDKIASEYAERSLWARRLAEEHYDINVVAQKYKQVFESAEL